MNRILEVREVKKKRGANAVLKQVNLTISNGQIVALLGPSGSGKTTLAEVIAGILIQDSGSIILDGNDISSVPPHVRRIPIAPQDWDLFPHLTALENVEFGLRVTGDARSHRYKIAKSLLEDIGLGDRAEAYPHELSGGQQQRVCFARALAVPSPFLIVDEPFANVDQDTRSDLRIVLNRAVSAGRGVLMITHDRIDALQMADHIVCLVEGRVTAEGSPQQVYMHPANLDVALLTGDAFTLPDSLNGSLTGEPARFLLIRPEWLVLSPPDASARWIAIIESSLYQGDHYLLSFKTGTATGQLRSEVLVPVGQRVGISIRDDIAPPVLTNENGIFTTLNCMISA